MQFQVPQFIETEDTVVGPLTIKQFGYLAAAGGIIVVLFLIKLQIWLWLILSVIFGGIAVAFAFFKVNGRPLSVFLRALFDNIWQPKLYIFHPKTSETQLIPEIFPQKIEVRGRKVKKPSAPPLSAPTIDVPITTAPALERTAPAIPIAPPPRSPAPSFKLPSVKMPAVQLPSLGGLKGLWQSLATTKQAIPKREQPLPKDFGLPPKRIKERYEIIRRLTGEREVARRIDYR